MSVGTINKKTLTEQVDEVLARGLEGEAVDPMLASLSPYARALWDDMVTQIRKSAIDSGKPSSEILEQLKVADYVSKPPTMTEFLEDPYYLGSILTKSQDSEGIFPSWKEILCRDFNYDSAIHNCVITGSLGIGKCLCHNELCLMYDGSIKPVQSIVVGDQLMGDDSTPRTVLSTTKGRGPLFQIYPAKGEPFGCNDAHILCLKSSTSENVEHVTIKDFLEWPREKKHAARIYRTGVEWSYKKVNIDPYWLGLWLGDGNTNSPSITSADEEIIVYHTHYAQSLGLTVDKVTDKRGNAASVYTATEPDKSLQRKVGNKLTLLLRSYGLCFGFKVEKHIPRDYLINSHQVRLQLLAGLLDTDGSKSAGGKCTAAKKAKSSNGVYEITLKHEDFANQVRFLAQSLGYFAQTKIKIVNSTAYYRTIISGAYTVPTHLSRKVSKAQGLSISSITGHIRKADCLRTKFAVIPKGIGDYYGFELDGNHRFLLKDFTVTHNTQTMVTILLYRILIATLLRNPHNFFGLTKGTKIIFNVLSVTKAAVTETAFGDAMNFMANSPYFLDECHYNPELRYTGFRIPLKGSLLLTAGSRGQHLIGRNIIGVGLDEGNWRLEAEPDTKAYELYNEVRNRINNRFRKVAGYLPAISILASSAKDESSFTETIISEIQKANDPSTQAVYRNSVYKIKRHTLALGPQWFKVAYGLKNIAPMILSGFYTEKGEPLGVGPHEAAPPGASVELVPRMYYDEFRRRPMNALRDVCGISTGGVNRWFASMLDFEACVELAQKDGVINPVTGGAKGFEMLPLSTEDNKQLWDYLDHKSFLTRVQSQIVPKRHPNRLRYCHIDLATTSMAGISICHLVGNELVENLIKPGEVIPFNEYRLIVEYDFILCVIAGQVKPISLEKVQNFIIWLSTQCGYNFGMITFDQFQSENSLQMLESKGFKVDKQSVDRSKDAYINWRSAIEEHRLRPYLHRHMMLEAENLLDGDKKVDHPAKGCILGNTRVRLLNGTAPTIEELALDSREMWVYASDGKGNIVPTKASNARITKYVNRLVRVNLDNEQNVVCTPEHLIMLRNGQFMAASDLKPGDSLMPFYRKLLIAYARSEEGRLKSSITAIETNRTNRKNWSKARLQSHKKTVQEALKLRMAAEDFKAIKKLGDYRPYVLGPCHATKITGTGASLSWKRRLAGTDWGLNAEKLRGKSPEEMQKLTGLSLGSLKNYLRKLNKYDIIGKFNHKVVSIESFSCCPTAVYDLTVEKYENFSLDCGIIVHNSKDVTDSASGAYNNAINSEEKSSMIAPSNPRVHLNRDLENMITEKPPVEINLPPGYERLKTFKV